MQAMKAGAALNTDGFFLFHIFASNNGVLF